MLLDELLSTNSRVRQALDEWVAQQIDAGRNGLETANTVKEVRRFQADIRAAREFKKRLLKAAEEGKLNATVRRTERIRSA